MNLTEAQLRNLVNVRDFGQSVPRSKAGYFCRIKGLSEFVWLFEDGEVSSVSNKEPREGAYLVKVVREQLTDAGRRALEESFRPQRTAI